LICLLRMQAQWTSASGQTDGDPARPVLPNALSGALPSVDIARSRPPPCRLRTFGMALSAIPDIRSERGDLSPVDASQSETDSSGVQRRSSLIAGGGAVADQLRDSSYFARFLR